jgi:hypothetical protein
MRMRRVRRAAVIVASIATAIGSTAFASAATAQAGQAGGGHPGRIQHVLLISVDGLHQQGLAWYVQHFPRAAPPRHACRQEGLDHGGMVAIGGRRPTASVLYRGTIQVVIQRCGSDPVSWRVSRHDIGLQRTACALTAIAMAAAARTAPPGRTGSHGGRGPVRIAFGA